MSFTIFSFDFKDIILNLEEVVNGLTWTSINVTCLVKLLLGSLRQKINSRVLCVPQLPTQVLIRMYSFFF